jgi:hypothetical protein
LNGDSESSVSPTGIQLAYADITEKTGTSSTFNNASINLSYPFTITAAFNTTIDVPSTPPIDGFCIALSANKQFIGNGNIFLGIVGGETPAVGIAVYFVGSSASTFIATNAELEPYPDSAVSSEAMTNIRYDITNSESTTTNISVTYNGSSTLSWTITEGEYTQSSSQSGINLESLLGSSTAYLGATAGSGEQYQPVYLSGATYQTYA